MAITSICVLSQVFMVCNKCVLSVTSIKFLLQDIGLALAGVFCLQYVRSFINMNCLSK